MPNSLKIIDLYSGVGGLSLSAVKAGFELSGAVEYEKRILDSHAKNFPKAKHICSDVSTLDGRSLLKLSKVKRGELVGLIGGPPCQGFSTIGKGSVDDARNQLFANFFKLAAEVKPLFFLAENVPGIMNEKYTTIRERAIGFVDSEYEILKPIKITANDFGAATTRTRVFFIGVRKDITGAHKISEQIFSMKTDVSAFVKKALQGLPLNVSADWKDYQSSWRSIQVSENSDYLNFINEIVDGVGDSQCINRFLQNQEVSGNFGTLHAKDVETRYSNLQPGQQDSISKSTRLKADGFCPTLRAGTDSTRGSFQAVRPIHYSEARVITPREAARLQGFPDWFQFHETKWHSFRQIGNSVCPIVGQKVLLAIKLSLNI